MKNILQTIGRLIKRQPNTQDLSKKIVVITGCDSGLGYSLSLKCKELGLSVVSGCLSLQSEGAKLLMNHCQVSSLDLTNFKSINSFKQKVKRLVDDGEHELHAVVNNAGIMIFGEFEWYTERQILQQIEVNMVGTFRMAKAFLPLLRESKGRLINITSHCALSNLPTLTVYGATKVAVQNWSDGLRMEQKKHGVKVITFIPGSFASQSNIMSMQRSYSKEMENALSEEDKKLYGKYFEDFSSYLSHVSENKKPLVPLKDEKLYKKFVEALIHDNPKVAYKHEPWRYFFYYNSFRVAPLWLRDYLIKKFMKFPEYRPNSG